LAYETTDEPEDRVTTVRKKWREAKEGLSQWREEARNSYAFVSGDQWSQEDLAKLQAEGRPAVTFNRTAPMVDAVSGLEINNRQSVRYYPREIGDVKPNEILTATADWIRDGSDTEDEESEAFKDAAICGVGVTETRMDYEDDPDGRVIDDRRDPLMVFPDPHSKKRSYKDARYVFHAEWTDKADIEARWPNKEVAWADDDLGQNTPGDGDKSFLYDGDNPDLDIQKDKALVLHYQCWKRETYYRLFDPFQQKNVELTEDEFKKLEKNGKKAGLSFERADSAGENDIAYVKQAKKVFYRGFYCGSTELEHSRSPIQSGFTFKFITAKRDRNKNCWYGIVRVLMDPQRWANKWLSQVLHIINTNAKGGAFVEEGALVDKRKAEEQWASASPLILLTEGSIDKVKERTPGAFPAGLDRLMHFAFESMPFVTGINLEMLGLASREQAGVLEQQRRKSAMAILAPLFSSHREFRKEKGRLYLEFIEKFIPEGKLVRIVGEDKAVQYVPFVKSPDVHKHDVVVDESPDSPDFKDQVWAGLNEILPHLIRQGVPIPAEVLAYSPLPSEVAEALQKAMQGSQPLPPEVQQQIEQMQKAHEQAVQENKKLKDQVVQLRADQQVEVLKLQAKSASDQQKLMGDMKKAGVEANIRKAEAQLEAKVEVFKAKLDAALEEHKIKVQAMTDLKVAALEARENAKQRAADKEKEDKKPKEKASSPSITIHNHIPKGGKKTIKTPKGEKYTVEED
jgi:hypothetical protein